MRSPVSRLAWYALRPMAKCAASPGSSRHARNTSTHSGSPRARAPTPPPPPPPPPPAPPPPPPHGGGDVFDLARVVAAAVTVFVEAGHVGLEVGQGIHAHGDVRLHQIHKTVQVLPVRPVVTGQQDRGVRSRSRPRPGCDRRTFLKCTHGGTHVSQARSRPPRHGADQAAPPARGCASSRPARRCRRASARAQAMACALSASSPTAFCGPCGSHRP